MANTRRDCQFRIHCNLGKDRSIRPGNKRPKFPTMEGLRHGKVTAMITSIHHPHGSRTWKPVEELTQEEKEGGEVGTDSFRGGEWTRENEGLNGESRAMVLEQKKSEKGTRNIVG